ncbi:MAG: PilN domain-containing protein [Gammaproteobacteria bacterium]
MTQQVNLYQPIFRAQPKVFSAVTIAQASLLLTLGLAAMYGYARWQNGQLDRQVTRLQAQQDELLKHIEDFSTRFPAKQKNPALDRQAARLTAERAGKARAVAVLSDGVFGNTHGFSTYFAGLAHQHVEGLWLTGLAIGDGGQQLSLSGRTVDAPLVPRYLQQLTAEPAFNGREFKTFQMARGTDTALIDFSLHTAADTKTP